MGAPTIGGDTAGTVAENSGNIVTGDLDDVGILSDTTDDTFSISASADYGTATIDPRHRRVELRPRRHPPGGAGSQPPATR